MGFDLHGFLISTNCEEKMPQVAEALQVDFTNKKEIRFEDACAHSWEKGLIKCFHASKGTIFFADTALFKENDFKVLSALGKVIVFELSEKDKAFCFRCFDDHILQWEDAIIMEGETEILGDGVLELSPEKNIIRDVFAPMCAELTGVNLLQIPKEAVVAQFELAKRTQPATVSPAASQPSGADVHEHYKKLFHDFSLAVKQARDNAFIRQEDGKEYHSFETYCRNKGMSEEAIKEAVSYLHDDLRETENVSVIPKEAARPAPRRSPSIMTITLAGALLSLLAYIIYVFGAGKLFADKPEWNWQTCFVIVVAGTALGLVYGWLRSSKGKASATNHHDAVLCLTDKQAKA